MRMNNFQNENSGENAEFYYGFILLPLRMLFIVRQYPFDNNPFINSVGEAPRCTLAHKGITSQLLIQSIMWNPIDQQVFVFGALTTVELSKRLHFA